MAKHQATTQDDAASRRNSSDLSLDDALPTLLPSPTFRSTARPLAKKRPALDELEWEVDQTHQTPSHILPTPEPSSDATNHFVQVQPSRSSSSINEPSTPPHRLIEPAVVEQHPPPAPRKRARFRRTSDQFNDDSPKEVNRKRTLGTEEDENARVWRERAAQRRRENEASFTATELDLEIRDLDRLAEVCCQKVAELCRKYMLDDE